MIVPRSKLDSYTLSIPAPAVSTYGRETVTPTASTSLLPEYVSPQSPSWRPGSLSTKLDRPARFWRRKFRLLAFSCSLSLSLGLFYFLFWSSEPPPRRHHRISEDVPWEEQVVTPESSMISVLNSSETDACDSEWTGSARFTSQGESIFIGTNATEAQDSFVDGALFVDVNPDPTESLLLLELDVSASDPELVQRIHVCVTHSPHRGIVIYTPDHFNPGEHISATVRLLYPQTASLLPATSLATNLPFFNHTFGDLDGRVSFDTVRIVSEKAPMVFQSLQANSVHVKTLLAPISGRFNIGSWLELDTISDAIEADILLLHPGLRGGLPKAMLGTGNGPINATVTMKADPQVHHPSFELHAKTFQAPLSVNIRHDPSTQHASMNALVNNDSGDCTVTVDSRFSGVFDVRTKLASAVFHDQRPLSVSQNRQPTFWENSKTVLRGQIPRPTVHGEERPVSGLIIVSSSMKPSTLNLVD